MMRLGCPFCGTRDHDEFTYEGNASVAFPPLDAPAEAWCEALFFHDNPRGRVSELWCHASGCRCFLVVERDTGTHEIFDIRLATPADRAALAREAGTGGDGDGSGDGDRGGSGDGGGGGVPGRAPGQVEPAE